MSGGSRDYVYFNIEAELKDKMYDPEINDLIDDIIVLAKSVELAESGDTDMEDYYQDVAKFKNKWFKQPRKDRLKKYIDESIDNTKKDLYQMVGIKTGIR